MRAGNKLFLVFALSVLGLAGRCDIVAAEPETKGAKPRSDKPKPQSTDLDDALLKDLDNELLEGAGDAKKPAPAKSEGEKPRSADEGEDVDMPSEEADPLVYISQEMRTVEELIPKATSRTHAEELQRRIVSDLERLIEQAEQQRASQQASSQKKKSSASNKRENVKQSKPGSTADSGNNSSKPAQDSTDRLGKAQDARPDPELIKGMMKDSWGHLPPRAREQMLQNSPERFLPQYELMIERYYQRLAEESNAK
jgi:hypothetical protein